MVFQVCQLGKAFHAQVTDVRLLASVNQFVPVKFGRSWKFFAAVNAFVAPVVNCTNGRKGQVFGCFEIEATAGSQSPVQHLSGIGACVASQAVPRHMHYLYEEHTTDD